MTPSKETRRAEGRGQPEGNPHEGSRVRTQSRAALPANLARVNVAAREAVQTRFTALLHHVDAEALERAFRRQKRQASAGVDGITVADYEQNLEANLQDLCARVHTGRYRPQPVRRVYIPKADGGRRPLGVPTRQANCTQTQQTFGICRGHPSVPPVARPTVCCPEGPHGLGCRDIELAAHRPWFVCNAAGMDRLGSARLPGLLRWQAVAGRRFRSGRACRNRHIPQSGRF